MENIILMKNSDNSKIFILLFLALLTAFGPFVTDMFLPSLPSMIGYFNTTASMIQMGLTTSMIGLAVGQLFFGPLSDKYGRKAILMFALFLFVVSSIGCLYSQTIQQFIIWRLVQGIGGAGGIVVSRAVAADKYSGKDLATMLATIGAIQGIAPVTAPVIGGFITDFTGWKGVFIVLLILGIILLLATFYFKESLPASSREEIKGVDIFKNFIIVFKNKEYTTYTLQIGFAQALLFSYIASSPFVLQQHYGFSPLLYSIVFGMNAFSISAGVMLATRFKDPRNSTLVSSVGMLIMSLILLAFLYMDCSFLVYEVTIVILLVIMGMSLTSSLTLAMNAEREHAGTASAILGAIGFAFGGIVSPLVGQGYIFTTCGKLFVICAALALVCTLIGRKIMTCPKNS